MVRKMGLLEALDGVLGIKRKPKDHKLKWKLLEERLTFPVEDADQAVGWVKSRLHGRFVGGGEFFETVYAKEFGEGVYGYFLVRTDKKTEEETVIAEAYMLQEEDRLGIDVASGFKIQQDFKQMGYEEAFQREFKAWWFKHLEIGITVYDISEFGALAEFSLPPTYYPKQREASEKKLFDAIAKIGLDKQEGVPTDAITLQMMEAKQARAAEEEMKRQAVAKKSPGAGLGSLSKLGSKFGFRSKKY